MLLLSEAAVEAAISPEATIAATRKAFAALAHNEVTIPLRGEIHRDNPKGTALIMPGLAGNEILGLKLVGHVADAVDPRRKYTTGMMLVWDASTLTPAALIAADNFNNHRTAGGIAVATELLAKQDAETLVQFGVGKIGFEAARYVVSVRPIKHLYLFGQRPDRIAAFVERARAHPDFAGIQIDGTSRQEDVVPTADVITTVTTAEEPVFDGSLVPPGTHINLAGANRPHQREMDDAVASRALFVLDEAEACHARAGDVRLPLEAGTLTPDRIFGTLGELLIADPPWQRETETITVFKSLGVAVQDLFVADALIASARAGGIGAEFDHLNG